MENSYGSYKEQIIELVESIEQEAVLQKIYSFIKGMLSTIKK